MARLFDDGSSESLFIAQTVGGTLPFAAVCWFKSDDQTVSSTLFSIADKDTDTDFCYLAARDDNPTKDFMVLSSHAGTSKWALSSAEYTQDVWTHACGIWVSVTDRRVLLNGGNKGVSVDNVAVANLDKTAIGILPRATPAQAASGEIAEVGVYDLSVWPGATDSDKADEFERMLPSLAGGYSPLCYPLGLIAYWPLIRGLKDKVGGYNLTADGTVISAHPRIILPCGDL